MDLLSGKDLRELGIYRAVSHANVAHDGWSDKAYKVLKDFIRFADGHPFMCEDVREYASSFIPEPPHKRAWGSIFVRARKDGIIKHYGFGQVTNPRAHRANASLWKGA